MRALILSPTPTSPTNYGHRKRVNETALFLRNHGYKIHLVHYISDHDCRDGISASSHDVMKEAWDDYSFVPASIDVHSAPQGIHHTIDEWWDPAIERHLRAINRSWNFDLFIVHYTWLSKAFEFAPPGALRILDTVDKFSDRKELLMSKGISPEYFYVDPIEEAKGLARADVVWAIKDEEAHWFETISKKKIVVVPHRDRKIPNFYHTRNNQQTSGERPAGIKILFTGARNNINVRNLSTFIRILADRLILNTAELDLLIAGSICEEFDNVDLPWVIKLGKFEHPEDVYGLADAVVIPMEFSTGIKIKVAEALSFGLPVVAHRHAFEGYIPYHRYHDLDNIEKVADACIELAAHPARLDELAAATEKSQLDAEKRFSDGIITSIKYRSSSSSNGLVILSNKNFDEGRSLLRSFMNGNMPILRHVSPVYVAITGNENTTAPKIADELGIKPDDWSGFIGNNENGIDDFASSKGVSWICPLHISDKVEKVASSGAYKVILHPDLLTGLHGLKGEEFCRTVIASRATGIVLGSTEWMYSLGVAQTGRFRFCAIGATLNPQSEPLAKKWKLQEADGVLLLEDAETRANALKSRLSQLMEVVFGKSLHKYYIEHTPASPLDPVVKTKTNPQQASNITLPKRPKVIVNLCSGSYEASMICEIGECLNHSVIKCSNAEIMRPLESIQYGVFDVISRTRSALLGSAHHVSWDSSDTGASAYWDLVNQLVLQTKTDIFTSKRKLLLDYK